MNSRPYHVAGEVMKPTFKEEVEQIKAAYVLKQEAEMTKHRANLSRRMQEVVSSMEGSIKSAVGQGNDEYSIEVTSENVKHRFLFWFPKPVGDGLLVWNKFIELGFSPKIRDASWGKYKIFVEL